MTRIGIITNPTSGRNKRRLEHVRAWTRASGAMSREVADLESIHEATRTILDAGVDVLAINGGDGTAQAVMTELFRVGRTWPDVAVLPGGSTNMTANDINTTYRLRKALDRLLVQVAKAPRERRRTFRPLMKISVPGRGTEYGLFMTGGVALRGMTHFREKVGGKGFLGELAAGWTLVRGMAGLARDRGGWSDVPPFTLASAGTGAWDDQILMVASTLGRLFLHFRPWWGEGDGPIKLTGVRRRPEQLIRTAPALLKGKENRRLTPEKGYRSARVDGLTLAGGEGFAIDGEIYPLEAGRTVTVEATDPIGFISV